VQRTWAGLTHTNTDTQTHRHTHTHSSSQCHMRAYRDLQLRKLVLEVLNVKSIALVDLDLRVELCARVVQVALGVAAAIRFGIESNSTTSD
jgi:hypothetical protein